MYNNFNPVMSTDEISVGTNSNLRLTDYLGDLEEDPNRIGLIAQDVISANPEMARFFVERSEKGFYSLRPADFVFP